MSEPQESLPNPWVLLGVIVVLWAASGLLTWYLAPSWEVRSQFGGMFGAASALFSGLALAGVVYAVWLQRQELSLQRRELALNREELRRSADAQAQSQAALNEQLKLQMLAARLSALSAIVGHLSQTRGDNPWHVFARSATGRTLDLYLKELEDLLPQLRGTVGRG
jgi:hypothetical protein